MIYKLEKAENVKCCYTLGNCSEGIPKDPVLCLECMSSSLNNMVGLFSELLKHATVPFPVGYAITVEFIHFVSLNDGLKKWFLENSRSEERKRCVKEMTSDLSTYLELPDTKVGIV
jgi:hypothetical protein